ncbi:RidA/YER057c/UK114 superfamily, group 1 [hydrothermal vent metagenome]|uniref:RidA/YER057c/UK114 superfamily, group 1 n=1 Tax=hydrothermal vent metagenome TaxID=652676 RepID=A0A3B0TX35_9ZZZZ
MTNPTERLANLGLSLPVPQTPLAAYVPVSISGNLLFVSGQLPQDKNGIIKGTLGANMEIEAGQEAARLAALSVLGQIVHTAGVKLENIGKILKLSIFVASTPDFFEHHLVANGASELIENVLGENGKHARAAFGVAALPLGAAVEIEAIVEISTAKDQDR